MAHRLQHLQKRRVDHTQTYSSTTQETHKASSSTPQVHSANQQTPQNNNYRPIFPSTNEIKQFEKNGFKKGQAPFPPPESLYAVKDTQVDPCFLRATSAVLYNQPRKTSLPTALWVTPFANEKVNVVDVVAPLRCNRCKAYVNPYFQFDGTHRASTCNLCGLRSNIDPNIDKNNMQAAQICTQSIIDFRVTDKFYFKKRTDIVKIIIVLELSQPIMQHGIFATIISSLKSVFQSHEFQDKIRVGVIFYGDQGVGYLRRPEQNEQPTIFQVPNNINGSFCCPLSDSEILFDPNQEREKLVSLFDFLQNYADETWKIGKFSHSANYVNALKSIKEFFEAETGKIFLFSFLDPRLGTCSIRPRTEQQNKIPLKPIHMQFFELARELIRHRIGVDHFYFSKDNLLSHELATTHFISSFTGGDLHYYNGYNDSQSQHLYYNIFNAITKPTYYDSDFTCRSSTGINVVRYGAPQGLRESRDVSQSIVTNTSSYTVQLEQQEKLDENAGAYIQFALMYTNGAGERRIRVINYKFQVSSRLESVYESLDYLTFAYIIAKNCTAKLLKTQPSKPRQDTFNWLGNIFGQFTSKCQSLRSVRIGDLTVPERVQWALSYIHTILNGKLFLSIIKTTSDNRICEYLKLHKCNPYMFSSLYYPKVYPLTLDIYQQEPLPGDFLQTQDEQAQRIAIIPQNLPLTKQSFKETGVYLYDAGDQIIILVQNQAPEDLLNDLFGQSQWDQIESEGLPELETSHNIRTNNIIAQIRRRSTQNGQMYQPLIVKTPFKKGPFGEMLSTICKQDYFDCNFASFIQGVKKALRLKCHQINSCYIIVKGRWVQQSAINIFKIKKSANYNLLCQPSALLISRQKLANITNSCQIGSVHRSNTESKLEVIDCRNRNDLRWYQSFKYNLYLYGTVNRDRPLGDCFFYIKDPSVETTPIIICTNVDEHFVYCEKTLIIYQDSTIYYGSISNQISSLPRAEGKGLLISPEFTYEGQFKNGYPHGYGHYHSRHLEFVGQFKNGQPFGQCIEKSATELFIGDIYQNGKRRGTIIDKTNSRKYVQGFQELASSVISLKNHMKQ